jgi:hypothetical protein
MTLLKRFRSLGLASFFFVSSLFFVVPTSSAHSLDGKNPTTAGCSGDATTMRSAKLVTKSGVVGGKIELRYSIKCHAAWARITLASDTPNNYSGNSNKAVIHRNTDGKEYSCSVPVKGTSCYTAMVYDKDPNSAYAKGTYNWYYFAGGWWDYYSGKTSSY